jgi:hypothetical protein
VDPTFGDLLNGDPEFSGDHFLLNYGTGGYGVGQICLLMKATVPLYERPVVVFSVMVEDVHRTTKAFRIGQKPCFRVVDGAVREVGGPIRADTRAYLDAHPPRIRSYVLAMLAHGPFVPRGIQGLFRGSGSQQEELEAVNAALIADVCAFLRERDVPVLAVIFHPYQPPDDGPIVFEDEEGWRSRFLRRTLDNLRVPAVFANDLLRADATRVRLRRRDAYFIEDGHPNERYNRLIAAEMKRFVLHPWEPGKPQSPER